MASVDFTHIKQRTVEKPNRTSENAVNFVSRKLLQFLQNWTEEQTQVIVCQPHTPNISWPMSSHHNAGYDCRTWHSSMWL